MTASAGTGPTPPGGAGRVAGPASGPGMPAPASSSRCRRHASRAPPSAYRISTSARLPGGPDRLRATSTVLRWPTTSRPRRIQSDRWSSRRSPLASSTAAASDRPSDTGSRTTSSDPARRASAASRLSRSPTRAPATAGSRPSGRSRTSRSTVRPERSAAASASASPRSTGVSTTSHSRRTPRATASTGSNARARSSQAAIAPPACASATVRRAAVVLPDEAAPRRATVVARGSPPVPRIASRAANPVETTRPSSSAGEPGRAGPVTGAGGAGVNGPGATSGTGPASTSATRASAPSTMGPSSLPRRSTPVPQRAWSVASAWETSDVEAIGRPIIERLFYSSRARGRFQEGRPSGHRLRRDGPACTYPLSASVATPTASTPSPTHCVGCGRSPR
jgi:hypothetical protein